MIILFSPKSLLLHSIKHKLRPKVKILRQVSLHTYLSNTHVHILKQISAVTSEMSMLKIYMKNKYFQIHVTLAETPLKLSGY